MISPKFTAVAAAIGFCLSFLIGLICGVSFGHLILRAFIFALVFAVLAIVVSVVFKFFLTVSNDGEAVGSSSQSSSSTGSLVNITLDDDALPEDSSAPKFAVENNRQSLGGGDSLSKSESGKVVERDSNISSTVSSSESTTSDAEKSESSESSAFQPVSLGAIASSSAGTNDSKPVVTSETNDLDELPELGDVNIPGISDNAGGESSSASSDSSSVDSSSSSSPSTSSSSNENSKLMAMAIRTAMANDNN